VGQLRQTAVSWTNQFVPSLSIIFQSIPSFLTPCPISPLSSRVAIEIISSPSPAISSLSGVREPDDVREGEGGGNALDGSLAMGRNDLDGVVGPGLYMSLEW